MFDSFFASISRWLGTSFEDIVEPENKDGEFTLSCKDGSLMSIFEIHGSLNISGSKEFESVSDDLYNAMRAYMSSGEHQVQFVFSSDPERLEESLSDMVAPSLYAAKKLGMDVKDLFEDDINALKTYCTVERVFLVVYTTTKGLSSAEIKAENKDRQNLFKEFPLPVMEDAPAFFRVINSLRSRHDGFVQTIKNDFYNANILLDLLPAHDAVNVMKDSISHEFTSKDWKPTLLGDKIPTRVVREGEKDYSGLVWPSISEQLLTCDTEEESGSILKVGNRYYCPMYIHLHQQDILPFKMLLNRVGIKVPWRMSFLIEPKGLSYLNGKDLVNLFFSFTSPKHNKQYSDAKEAVEVAVKEWNDQDVRYRVDFVTWGRDIRSAENNAEFVARAVQGWGVTEIKSFSGSLVKSYVGTCVGITRDSMASPSVANLSDVISHLPVHRPASPWKKGNILFRSRDGKVFPHQPMSTLVTSAITCFIAEPRYGKSLQANRVNWSLLISPGNDVIPLISVIDVGRASSGLISLLQYKLPPEKRHVAANIQLLNDNDHRINPCDTQLRCRYPIGTDRDFLRNIALLLLTADGSHNAPDGMEGIVDLAIDCVYREFSDEVRPKTYVPGRCVTVDSVLNEIGFFSNRKDGKISWWEVVDALFAEARYHEASLAQRYAVPTIPDMIPIVNGNPQFTDLYSEKRVGSEPILRVYTRLLSEAIRKYPIISGDTTWDIGTARVIAINLEHAIDKQRHGCQKNALMYMIAMFVSTRNYTLNEDLIPSYDAECRDYHKERILELRRCKKHIQFDEWHRGHGIVPLENMVGVFLREGGKWDIATTLISHRISDFPAGFLEWVTTLYVLSPQSEEAAQTIAKTMKLSETAVSAMMNEISLPNKEGSTFVGVFRTSSGNAVHLLKNTVGSQMLWSLSTSSEDGFVRDRLYERIGDTATRKVLSRLYPNGSLKSEYEDRKTRLANTGHEVDERKASSILDEMVEEAYRYYTEMRTNGEI